MKIMLLQILICPDFQKYSYIVANINASYVHTNVNTHTCVYIYASDFLNILVLDHLDGAKIIILQILR